MCSGDKAWWQAEFERCKELASKGDLEACYRLAFIYWQEMGVTKQNDENAFEYAEKVSDYDRER